MTLTQQIITVAMVVLGTMITRFLPFALHVWKRQMLLSIAGGTILYMLLVQFVF